MYVGESSDASMRAFALAAQLAENAERLDDALRGGHALPAGREFLEMAGQCIELAAYLLPHMRTRLSDLVDAVAEDVMDA